MNINKPLIVFGRDAAVTYPLLLAIAKRREREEAKAKRRRKAIGFLRSIFCMKGGNDD